VSPRLTCHQAGLVVFPAVVWAQNPELLSSVALLIALPATMPDNVSGPCVAFFFNAMLGPGVHVKTSCGFM